MKIIINEQQYKKLIYESYLTKDQLKGIGYKNFKQLNDSRLKGLWDNIFGNKMRIYIPYIDSTNTYQQVKKYVEEYIKNKYNIDKELTPEEYKRDSQELDKNNKPKRKSLPIDSFNYTYNYFDKKQDKEVTVTKTIKDLTIPAILTNNQELLRLFEIDKSANYISLKNDLLICLSRLPIDVATMSTNRDWYSCTKINVGGSYKCIPDEIKNGMCVAYLIRSDDKDINKPIARVGIRTYVDTTNPKNMVLYVSDKTYPGGYKEFREQVAEFIYNKQGDIDLDKEFQLSQGSYNDDPRDLPGFNFQTKEKYKKYFEDLKEIDIQSYIYYLNKGYYSLIPKNIKITGLSGNNISYILNNLPENKRFHYLNKTIKNNIDFIDTVNIDNVPSIILSLPKDERMNFLNILLEKNKPFKNSINDDNIIRITHNLPPDDIYLFIKKLTEKNKDINTNN